MPEEAEHLPVPRDATEKQKTEPQTTKRNTLKTLLKRFIQKPGKEDQKQAESPSQEPDVPNGEIEFDFPYLKIPNGYSSEDQARYNLTDENEPSKEDLEKFFTEHPDAKQRIVFCQQINRDETDDWGMSGYEPGYLFIVGKRYSGKQTLADETFIQMAYDKPIQTKSGIDLPQISSYDFFPKRKYSVQLVTAERTPQTFAHIDKMLHTPKPGIQE